MLNCGTSTKIKMNWLILFLVSLVGSSLTLYSGFGLGTLILPVFSLFFPLPIAVAMTAVVHLLNNFLKLSLFLKHANWRTVLLFGISSVIGALIGAYVLNYTDQTKLTISYSVLNNAFTTTPIKVTIGSLMILFAIYELWPGDGFVFKGNHLLFGGILSGFFGGLSGHQGALRSAFLINLQLPKEVYIGTGVTIACLVDLTRIPFYIYNNGTLLEEINLPFILVAIIGAFLGVFIGNKLMKKVTIKSIQRIVGGLLLVYGILLTSGII
jgi:uncharacterized membrane protein YfcA